MFTFHSTRGAVKWLKDMLAEFPNADVKIEVTPTVALPEISGYGNTHSWAESKTAVEMNGE